ncbi:MAG: NDP-sugar synthase [Candidatus Competibacteraceae bacterium]|nr:MAG: NDP-sugar synthase [Candidatus Competibacteraceae bacterium]
MQALIFADRLGRELEPLTDRTCAALLPVTGKPVLEHTLEALVAAGLREAVVAVSPFADELRAALGDGSRWGIRLNYVLTHGEEDPDTIVESGQSQLADELLALRGDVLHGAALGEFLRLAAEVTGPVVYGRAANAPVSLCLHRVGGRSGLEPLLWSAEPVEMLPTWPVVELPGAVLNRLESPRAYHQVNLDAAAGRFPGLIVPGQPMRLGLTVGPRSKVSPRSLRQGVAFVGGHCRVEASAEFYGEVVIANRVIVDRHASLRDSVVLSDAYIGERLDIRNAIVQGNRLIQVDTGAVLPVIETVPAVNQREAMSGGMLAESLNRLLGLLLLLLSLPLWPLALVAALSENFDDPLRETRLRGNRLEFDEIGGRRRQAFVAMEWMTSIPLLRHLPRLLAVVSGDLRLVGAEPLTPEQADSQREDWERLADRAPAGLIGPTQLILPASAPREARLMSDVFYSRQHSAGKDLRYLLLGAGMLFTPRAWWPG